MRKLIYILILFLLFSCGKPSDDIETVNFLYLLDIILDRANEVSGNLEEQKVFFEEAEKLNAIINFKKNTEIRLKSKEAEVDDETIGYSLNDNKFVNKVPIYVTGGKKGEEMLFSLDNKTWYSSNNDPENGVQNIISEFKFEKEYDEENSIMDITYCARMKLNKDNMVPTEVKGDREVIFLEEGQVFLSQDGLKDILLRSSNNKVNVNLDEKILYIPAETTIEGNILVEGNLISIAENDTNGYVFTFLQEIFIYLRNNMISFSFNKKDWSFSIFSFEIVPQVQVVTLDDNKIFMNIYVKANYNKKE